MKIKQRIAELLVATAEKRLLRYVAAWIYPPIKPVLLEPKETDTKPAPRAVTLRAPA